MVRRRHRVVRGKRGYKKCIISALKGTKFHTPKAARKAFSRAAKRCRKKFLAGATRRRASRRCRRVCKPRRKAHRRRRKAHRRRRKASRRGYRLPPWTRRTLGVSPGEFGMFSTLGRGRRRR